MRKKVNILTEPGAFKELTFIYWGPPQGGLKKTMSALIELANVKKSPIMNSILSATP